MRRRAILVAGAALALVLGIVWSKVAPAGDGPRPFPDVTGTYSGFFQSSADANFAGTLEMRITAQDGPRFSGTASLGIPDASGDIEALAFIVLGEATKSTDQDLQAMMNEVKEINATKAMVRGTLSAFDGGASLANLTYDLQLGPGRRDRGTAVILRSYVGGNCNPPNITGSYIGGFQSDDGTTQGFVSAQFAGQLPVNPTSFLAAATFQPSRSDASASWNNGRGTVGCDGNAIIILPPNFGTPGPVLQGRFTSDSVTRFQGRYTGGPALLAGSGTFAIQTGGD
jgi:hypothetical protein